MTRAGKQIDGAHNLIDGIIDEINNEEYEAAKFDLDVASDLLFFASLNSREVLVDYDKDGVLMHAWQGGEGKVSYIFYNYDNGRISTGSLPYEEFVESSPWFDDMRHFIHCDKLRRDAMIKLHGKEVYEEHYANECEEG